MSPPDPVPGPGSAGWDPGASPRDPGSDPDFRPTHVVPRGGLPSWEAPDPDRPTVPLDAFLPVRLTERTGDWGRVLCSNGWSAWVDARLLVSVPDDPPAAGPALSRTADPRPLIARAEDALGRYRRAVDELAAGRADGETFRRRTRGLRVGMVVDGESVWLYDAEHERWVYGDGAGLTTYAASAGPSRTSEPSRAAEPSGAAGAGPEEPVPPGAAAPEAVPPGDDDGPGTEPVPGAESGPGRKPEPVAGAEPVPEARPAPVGYQPTQVVPLVDPAASGGPPPTRVVRRPPDAEDGS
ncbi:hypothetical protein GCM10010363_75590 [Streptomyces omiyaensis]|uniref:hypothetical protein n=1 Tax=Streptomyces omiyaensis TaxID=68247 RepID=UPI001991F838|nr:hypothetical protein GCM10010363_75590 [Streptomyces omiyaensis]